MIRALLVDLLGSDMLLILIKVVGDVRENFGITRASGMLLGVTCYTTQVISR